MSNTNPIQVIENVVLISLVGTQLWTGRAKMNLEDLGLDSDDLPPNATLGSKPLIDLDDLAPLRKFRYEMHKVCAHHGTKFMGGYAIAVTEAREVVTELNNITKQANACKELFLQTLSDKIKKWHEANPDWQTRLKSATPAVERIRQRINFGFVPTMVTPPSDELVAANFHTEVGSMGNKMVTEVVKEAAQFVKQSLKAGREDGSQKTAEPIRRLAKKLHSLRFLEPSLATLSEVLNRVLLTIPTKGKIEGEHYFNLARVANLLADRNRMKATADALQSKALGVDELVYQLTGHTAQDILELPVGAPEGTQLIGQIFDDQPAAAIPVGDADVLEAVAAIRGPGNAQTVAPKPARTMNARLDF